jgi:hypothetical protein
VKETQAIKRARVDAVIDGFDLVRKRLNPTNGECLAIFTVLAADILNASGDVADELLRPARSVLNTMGQDGECLRALFERCGLPTRAPKKQILEAPNQTPVDPLAVHAVVQRADDFLHGRVSASYSETIVKQLMQALTEAVAARQQAEQERDVNLNMLRGVAEGAGKLRVQMEAEAADLRAQIARLQTLAEQVPPPQGAAK